MTKTVHLRIEAEIGFIVRTFESDHPLDADTADRVVGMIHEVGHANWSFEDDGSIDIYLTDITAGVHDRHKAQILLACMEPFVREVIKRAIR